MVGDISLLEKLTFVLVQDYKTICERFYLSLTFFINLSLCCLLTQATMYNNMKIKPLKIHNSLLKPYDLFLLSVGV